MAVTPFCLPSPNLSDGVKEVSLAYSWSRSRRRPLCVSIILMSLGRVDGEENKHSSTRAPLAWI